MTAREYLSQGYRLKQRIGVHKNEIAELRELAISISSPGFEEHFSASGNTDAPFEKIIFKICEMESEQAKMLDVLLQFKKEMLKVISDLEDKDERMVLHYRYVNNWTWVQIGEELGWDERTIRRWHNKALSHVRIPKNPTVID